MMQVLTPLDWAQENDLVSELKQDYEVYGTDMNDKTHPYECNLGWTVDMNDKERHFIGKKSLMKIDPKKSKKLVGVVLEDKGILRAGYKISDGKSNGEILSGTFSPVLKKVLGLQGLLQSLGQLEQLLLEIMH